MFNGKRFVEKFIVDNWTENILDVMYLATAATDRCKYFAYSTGIGGCGCYDESWCWHHFRSNRRLLMSKHNHLYCHKNMRQNIETEKNFKNECDWEQPYTICCVLVYASMALTKGMHKLKLNENKIQLAIYLLDIVCCAVHRLTVFNGKHIHSQTHAKSRTHTQSLFVSISPFDNEFKWSLVIAVTSYKANKH